jgi:hypothetical protein
MERMLRPERGALGGSKRRLQRLLHCTDGLFHKEKVRRAVLFVQDVHHEFDHSSRAADAAYGGILVQERFVRI